MTSCSTSALSPYIFALYLDDLTTTCSFVPGVCIILYADDITGGAVVPALC